MKKEKNKGKEKGEMYKTLFQEHLNTISSYLFAIGPIRFTMNRFQARQIKRKRGESTRAFQKTTTTERREAEIRGRQLRNKCIRHWAHRGSV